jgi:hypothetical protein
MNTYQQSILKTFKLKLIMSTKTIETIGQLREFIDLCDTDDLVVMETTDLETGDPIDLYPFYIDVIEGIQTTDGKTISEIRFCQLPNEPLYNVQTNYHLVKVMPDCGGGICDTETDIIMSDNINKLKKFCQEQYSYSPLLGDKRSSNDKEFCKTWYKIVERKVNVL